LWRELRDLGYPGTARQAHRWLAARRTAPAKTTAQQWRLAATSARVDAPGDRNEAVAGLTASLVEARRCGVPVVATFAAGLEQDGAAVRAALTLPWGRGQAEGQITRLKRLKRSMYGRASFDLLRQCVLLAA
jgi:transposase